jgi:hypothetical protein
MSEQHLKLADVFYAGFKRYIQTNGPLPMEHYDVANAVMRCHTAAMGGHVFRCPDCNTDRITYNSCRNRHCPSCQALARAKWVEARTKELLPVPYFHVVFTVPSQLNPFALRNKEVFYNILFAAASQTIRDLGKDDKRLGGEPGSVAVLHTWGQNVLDHPHLHFIVPAGGLDDDRWVPCKNPKFLFPVKVMSELFKGKFLDAFKSAITDGSINMYGTLAVFSEQPAKLKQLIDGLYKIPWVVYAKPPFGGPRAVVKYLGRYTHRIAISNARLISLNDTHVSFQWKDYRNKNRSKVMTLTIGEFIRRFLLHVLPGGFVRIRYFGFMANCTRTAKLQLLRDQIDPAMALAGGVDSEKDEEEEQEKELGPVQERTCVCPVCKKATMVWRMKLPRPVNPVSFTSRPHRVVVDEQEGGAANAA